MASSKMGRPASGLPRYYMDCGWYRHPRFAGLAPDVLFTFDAIVGYCTEHGTEGYAPADPDTLATVLGLRAAPVKKALPALVEREALIDKGWQVYVRGWGDHNPTKAEVEAKAQERSEAGTLGNHVRWHLGKGVTDPTCTHCLGGDSDDPFGSQ